MDFSKEQIEEYKKKFGENNVYLIEVEDKSCLVRKPNREVFSFVAGLTDPIERSAAVLGAVWIDGDEEMRQDDDYFLPAIGTLDTLLKQKEAQIKKL